MRERRSNDGGCGACGRTDRPAVGMAHPAFWRAGRQARGRGRTAPPMAPSVFGRRDRRLLSPQSRASLMAWRRRGNCGSRLADCGAPVSRLARSGACIHCLCRGLCVDAGGRLGARGADVAAAPRATRRHGTSCRHRSDGEGLAHRDRRRSGVRPRCERSAAPSARAYSAKQQRTQPRRPRQPQGDALSGARADFAGRARLPARALFRRHRRGRVHLWRRASGRRAGERGRVARESAAATHRNDAADRRRPSWLDRRCGFGADHRQTRRDHRRGQASLSRYRSVAPAGDRRLAPRARRRLCVFRRARRIGADPADRVALSDQENRRLRDSPRARLLSAALGRRDPDPAGLCHERPRLRCDHHRSAADLDAGVRNCRNGRARHRPVHPCRSELSDVIRRGCRVDCRIRDLWGAARPAVAQPLGVGKGAGLLRGCGDYDRGRDIGHLPLFDLPFPPYRALLATRQCHRSAAERDVDIAVGCGDLPVDAARPRAAGAGADGLGD